MQAWPETRICKSFARHSVRDAVAPAYMGLIKELDDNLGRLFAYLEEIGRIEDTMLVFCSDHGDNMRDHGLGEKDLFYDCLARVPLIIYDPRRAANATRGTGTEKLVEGIDLAPTFIEALGGAAKPYVLEGRSLTPLLHGDATEWRTHCISEYGCAIRDARRMVGVDQADARLVIVFDGRCKYVHVETMQPMLFDRETDPGELHDLGERAAHAAERARLAALRFDWARQHHARITRTPEMIEKMADAREPEGIYIAYWDQAELEANGLKMPAHIADSDT